MFDLLSSKLEATFKRLRSRGKLTESDIDEALIDIRVALLEADVNLEVVQTFCADVKKKAIGMKVLKSLNPGQMVIKFVHEQLQTAMGQYVPLNLRFAPPVIIMLVGLQGSGKTTSCAKLAHHFSNDLKRNPLLVSVDVYRPAAIEQLRILAKKIDVDFYESNNEQKPVDIASSAVAHAKLSGLDTVIIDTAGRLQIDQNLMRELVDIVKAIEPHEILLVADAMTGQEAVKVANGFNSRLDIDGLILSKLDGDARGGAALSMHAATGKPIKFIGVGEKIDALEPFHPDRLASRILGMGDVLTLIEKASREVNIEEATKLQKKLKKNQFTFEDFYSQMQMIKKMGSISSLVKMIPGAAQAMKGIDEDAGEKEMKRVEALILSMTPQERKNPSLIDGSRRKRIAKGSGNTVEDLNRLLQQFSSMQKMMGKLGKLGSGAKGLRSLQGMIGGNRMPPSFR